MPKKRVCSWCVIYREGKSVYDVEGERMLVDLAGAEHLHERAPLSSEAGFLCVCA